MNHPDHGKNTTFGISNSNLFRYVIIKSNYILNGIRSFKLILGSTDIHKQWQNILSVKLPKHLGRFLQHMVLFHNIYYNAPTTEVHTKWQKWKYNSLILYNLSKFIKLLVIVSSVNWIPEVLT